MGLCDDGLNNIRIFTLAVELALCTTSLTLRLLSLN